MPRTKHKTPEINSSFLADLGFLLLTFFLIISGMDVEKGLVTYLPPPYQDGLIGCYRSYNRLDILVNSNDKILLKGKPLHIQELRKTVKLYVDNRGENPIFSDSPQKAVISLKNDRGTSYERYVEIHNEIRAAYNEMRNEYSQRKYHMSFKELPKKLQLEVREVYPILLSEAEPEDFWAL